MNDQDRDLLHNLAPNVRAIEYVVGRIIDEAFDGFSPELEPMRSAAADLADDLEAL